jgi:aminopeptidase N
MRAFSQWFGPYPYPRLTIVDVPEAGAGAGGMEYPTLITAGTLDLGLPEFTTGWERTLELVVIHEAGHQWFMGLLASNEAEEPWLDEGFTDYATVRLVEQVYGPGRSAVDLGGLRAGYLDMRRMEYLSDPSVPMYGRAWDFGGMQYGIASYSKPALGLLTLEGVLGEETMLRVLAAYTTPVPLRAPHHGGFPAGGRRNQRARPGLVLRGLVYGTGTLNYRAEAIDARSLSVARDGQLVIPTEIQLTFAGRL